MIQTCAENAHWNGGRYLKSGKGASHHLHQQEMGTSVCALCVRGEHEMEPCKELKRGSKENAVSSPERKVDGEN